MVNINKKTYYYFAIMEKNHKNKIMVTKKNIKTQYLSNFKFEIYIRARRGSYPS